MTLYSIDNESESKQIADYPGTTGKGHPRIVVQVRMLMRTNEAVLRVLIRRLTILYIAFRFTVGRISGQAIGANHSHSAERQSKLLC